jgi:hypothetical protein
MAGQGLGHMQLLFVPVPPLLLYFAYDMLFGQRTDRTRLVGVVVGLLLTAQFFTSTEILAGLFMMGVFGTVAVLVLYRDRLKQRWLAIKSVLGWASLTFSALCIVPAILLFEGADHYVGPAQVVAGLDALRSDLFSAIDPTVLQLIDPVKLNAPLGDTAEAGLYLGIPLLVFLCVACWTMRSRRVVRGLAVMVVVAWVLTLGPRLDVAGHTTWFPLPFAVLSHLPVFYNLVPSRLSLYVFLFCIPLVGMALDRVHSASVRTTGSTFKATGLVGVIVVLILVPLIPSWPYSGGTVVTPSFFTSPAEKLIPSGSTVVTYPYPVGQSALPMSWQAIDGMRYKLVGGYIITALPDGHATFNGTLTEINGLEGLAYLGWKGIPRLTPKVAMGIKLDLEVFQVSTVIVTNEGSNPRYMIRAYTDALKEPGRNYDGTYVWFDVQQRLAQLNGVKRP